MDKPRTVPLSLLKGDAKNPRRIKDDALAGLKVSMESFGDLSGVVWNQRTGELVCGHQRVRSLNELGAAEWTRYSETEGVIVHPKTGERFPVRVVDWDETTQRMANLVANNPHIAGEYTEEAFDQLRALEQEVKFADLGLHALTLGLENELNRASAELPEEFREFDENAADDVKMLECPACHHKFPK